MPIEIKEINIKADVYPSQKSAPQAGNALSAAETERLKRELTKEITAAVLQKLHQSIER